MAPEDVCIRIPDLEPVSLLSTKDSAAVVEDGAVR